MRKINIIFVLFFLNIYSIAQIPKKNNTNQDSSKVSINIMPFNFSCIYGMTKQDAEVGNEVNPDPYVGIIFNYYEKLPSKIVYIGKVYEKQIKGRSEKNKMYFEGYYHGKQFFISADNIILDGDMIRKIDTLRLASNEIQNTFQNNVKKIALNNHIEKNNKIQYYFKTHKKYGLSILDWNIYDESEYTDGTSFSINLINPTKKTIKYVTINIVGYNSVKDKIISKGKYTQSIKCVGPIAPEEQASYNFEYVWFTDLVNNAKITSITVQYMDGTIKTINNEKLVKWDSDMLDYLNEDYSKLKNIRVLN